MLLQDEIFPRRDPEIGHVVVTRYNQHNHTFRRAYAQITDDEGHRHYLRSRFPQFRDVCLPSMLALRRRPDRWLIGFDGRDPSEVADVMELIDGHDWIEPLWQGPDENWRDSLARGVDPMREQYGVLAETRCDNDDALASNYLGLVHRYAIAVIAGRRSPLDFWILFSHGAQLHEGKYRQHMQTRPHFGTRVTRGVGKGPDASVYAVNHSHYRDHPSLEVYSPITKRPVWLENVHGTNLSNREQRVAFELQPTSEVAASFGLGDSGEESTGSVPRWKRKQGR